VKGIRIIGISSFHDEVKGEKRGSNTIYHINMDKLSIVHLGDLGHKLDDQQLEWLDGVNILFLPVGGFYTVSVQTAMEVVSQLEPNIIIPMHYNHADLKQENFKELDSLDLFLKEMGKQGAVPQPKLVISKDKLPVETTVVILQRS